MVTEALAKLASLWERERAATRARFAEERRGTTLADRVARGIALADVVIDEAEAAPGGRTRLWLRLDGVSLDDVRIGTGDPVKLWWTEPDAPDAVPAIVGRRGGGRLAVVVDGDVPERLDEGRFHVDREAPEVTFVRGARAIANFRGRLAEIFFGDRPPELERARPLAWFDDELEDAQREAVALALVSLDVALVHGPPGTGKTRTLAEVVRQCVARGERVLVTAASHTAVDNLAERLLAGGVPLVRVGHPARVAPALEERTVDALVDASEASALARRWSAEAREIRRRVDRKSARGAMDRSERRAALAEARTLLADARTHLARAQEAILARVPVVCATAAGSDVRLLDGLAFDRVILDEATQAPDPIALVALSRAQRCVLAGDPEQLPPTIIDPEAARLGLATTLFERLAARVPGAVRLLEVQHRMHAGLMAFSSRMHYGGRLRAHPAVAARAEVPPDPLRPPPLVFIDTAGRGWAEERGASDPSLRNPEQATRTAAEVRRLLRRGVPGDELGVITPYDAHARLLREALRGSGVEIGTVDGFQGREKEVMVVDLVRSNDFGDLGFLADVRRMNVALTRARSLLLVIGDSATLGGHPYYAAFFSAVEEHGVWVSAWSDDPDDALP